MQLSNTLPCSRHWRMLTHALRHRPGLRSVVYLAGAATLLRAVSGVYTHYPDIREHALHLTILPFGAAWTLAFIRLREEDVARWKQIALWQGLRQAGLGIVLGAGAFMLVVGTAVVCGWARVPGWGWEQASPAAIVRTLLATAPENLAAAWNEELVFRGYGLDAAGAAIGQPVAIAGLTTLFAWAHGRSADPYVLMGTAAGGLAMVALRYRSGALWMPVGYHFAWNYVQMAVFGPAGELPSIRPVEFTGPELWIGRPGHPEPGLLATIVNLCVALFCVIFWQRRALLRTRTENSF